MATLFSPTGQKYETDSKLEATRLRSRGYSDKKPTPTEVKVAKGEIAPKS